MQFMGLLLKLVKLLQLALEFRLLSVRDQTEIMLGRRVYPFLNRGIIRWYSYHFPLESKELWLLSWPE